MRNALFKAGLAGAVLALTGCASLPKLYEVESKEVKKRIESIAKVLKIPVNSLYEIADKNPEDKYISKEEADRFSNAFYEIFTGKWPKELKVPYDEGLEN